MRSAEKVCKLDPRVRLAYSSTTLPVPTGAAALRHRRGVRRSEQAAGRRLKISLGCMVKLLTIRSDSFTSTNEEPALKRFLKRSEAAVVVAAPRRRAAATKHPSARSLEDVRELLGPAWIIEGEDPERYEQLLARVAEAVGPVDFIDWLLIKDICALTWEIQRSRRHRETVIRIGRLEALQQILEQVMPRAEKGHFSEHDRVRDIRELATKWVSGDSQARRRIAEVLRKSEFSIEDVAAHSMTVKAFQLERIDLQVDRAESRRDSVLRAIERRRVGRVKGIQRAGDVVEAEFSELPARDKEPSGAVVGGESGE